MATNPYFRSSYNGNADQALVESLLIECIKINGLDCEYIPYTMLNEDKIYGEDTLHLEYTKAFPLEMYVESVQGFEGEDFLSKFGLQIQEKFDLVMSMRRFRQACNYEHYRPREKDLVYFQISDSLYEITFVQHEKPFHQLGMISNSLFQVRLDLFNYSHQKLLTGVHYIDKFENDYAFILKFTMDTGTGRYLWGEPVYQGPDINNATAKAVVASFHRDDKILKLKEIWGQFDTSLPIIGLNSRVSYTVATVDERELPTDPIANNKPIKDEVIQKDVINNIEKSPFGDPV